MNRHLSADMAWGGGIVVLALAATAALQLDFIDEDTSIRMVLGATGVMLAWYGNRMPKTFVASEYERKITRIGGWSMAISGTIYAALWAFAPIPVAVAVGCGAILAGVAVTALYGRSLKSGASPG